MELQTYIHVKSGKWYEINGLLEDTDGKRWFFEAKFIEGKVGLTTLGILKKEEVVRDLGVSETSLRSIVNDIRISNNLYLDISYFK